MARKARWLGLLATYRELSPCEREAVDRHLEDDPQGRELARQFAEQDALLGSLTPPCPSPALRERVMAATVARRDGAIAPRWRPALAAVLSLVLLVLVAGTGVASSGSLPGDTLYPVKRASEQVRLALTLREQGRFRYMERLGEIRRQEVNALLGLGRAGVPVAFEGPLERSPEGEWLVAGVPIVLAEDADDPSQIATGEPVHVVGEIEQAQVRVQTMRPLDPSSAPAGPRAEPQPSHHGADRPAAAPPSQDQPTTTSPAGDGGAPAGEGVAGDEAPSGDAPTGDGAPPPTAEPTATASPTPTAGADADAPQDPPEPGQPDRSTAPGRNKGPGTPAVPTPQEDEDERDAGASTEGQDSAPARDEPAPDSRGAVDRAPDGQPSPTQRPPFAGPPDRRQPKDGSVPAHSAPEGDANAADAPSATDAPAATPTPPPPGHPGSPDGRP